MCFICICGGNNLFHLQYKIRRFNVFPACTRQDSIQKFHGQLNTDEYIYTLKQLSLNLSVYTVCLQGHQQNINSTRKELLDNYTL